MTPRVSILIPNFNNGSQSALGSPGGGSLIEELLRSLDATLGEDRARVELLAYDDGSTDDSLDTLRRYRDRGLIDELIEGAHTGVLARHANLLSAKARGEFLVRLDGDVVIHTPGWVSLLIDAFERHGQGVGVLAPMQLGLDGRVHACGDWLIHPNGYTHVDHGVDPARVKAEREVDHAMGCFYVCRQRVWEELGGYDESFLRGQTLDFGLRARLAGWRCWTLPGVVYTHQHGRRVKRDTLADSDAGLARTLAVWRGKWGFDRACPDLTALREQLAETPLRDHPWLEPRPVMVEPLPAGDEAERDRRQVLVLRLIGELAQRMGRPRRVVEVGVEDARLGVTLAGQGVAYVGVDASAVRLAAARRWAMGSAARYRPLGESGAFPVVDGWADWVVFSYSLERAWNPSAWWREAARVTAEGGLAVVVSHRLTASDPPAHAWEHRFYWTQLVAQAQSAPGWEPLIGRDPTMMDEPMVAVARRVPRRDKATTGADPLMLAATSSR